MMATYALSEKGLALANKLNPDFSRKTNQQLMTIANEAKKAALVKIYSKAFQRLKDTREP